MKSFKYFALAVLLGLTTGCGYEKAEPGWVGLKVPVTGDGANDPNIKYELKRGRIYYNPVTTDIYLWPTFMQQYQFTQKDEKASPGDQSFTFNSREGEIVNIDLGISIQLVSDSVVSDVFKLHRRSMNEIIQDFVHSRLSNALNNAGRKYTVQQIFGPEMTDLLAEVTEELQRQIDPHFKLIGPVFVLSEPRVNESVKQAIAQVITANQEAAREEAKVRTIEAQAQQRIAQARGDSSSSVIRAAGQAEANRRIQASLTRELIEYEKAQKWDGKLPNVTGNAVPFIQMNQ